MTKRTLGLIALACVGVAVLGAGLLVRRYFISPRPPTDLESFQYLVAIDFGVPELCDRIGRHAVGGGSWESSRGLRILRLRSQCFFKLALMLNQPSLCDGVEPARTLLADGSRYNRAYCLGNFPGSSQSRDRVIADPNNTAPFIGFMRRLGYGDREVMEAKYQENQGASPTLEPFDDLRRDAAFLSKLRAARDYNEAPSPGAIRPAHPVEVLYQMVAIVTPDASLCAKVSPNATLVDYGGRTPLLRASCFATIANNTHDAALCGRLPRAGSFPLVTDQSDSAEACAHGVAVNWRPSLSGGDRLFEPMPFAHASDFADALRDIGYTSEAVTRAATPEDGEYWQFVSRLSRSSTPPEARAEFVRRALTLR